MTDAERVLAYAEGDGEVTAESLAVIRQKVEEWNGRAGDFWDRRVSGESARYCIWDGQSDTGRIWAADNGGVVPKPFDGASDQRIRWADGIVLDKAAVILNGLALADIKVKATGAAAGRIARNLTVALRWMINNMGAEWIRQWKLLASYYLGDSPAVALMGVEWRREERVEYRRVTVDELVEMYTAARVAGEESEGVDATAAIEDAVARMRLLLEEGEGDAGEAEALLVQGFGITEAAARRVVRELQKNGESEFPARVYGAEGPVLRAMRMGDDFIVPDNATDFERVGMWFRTEWLTQTELEAKRSEDGWSESFVAKTLDGGERMAVLSDALGTELDAEQRKGLWQVVYVYHEAVNADGVRSKYVTVISHADETAFGRRMLRGTRGRWPAVFFQREVADRWLMSSRGVPEIAAPHQGAAKKLRDTCTDNGVVGGLPPFLAKGVGAQRNEYLEPMIKVNLRINEDLAWMNPPQYPVAAQKVFGEISNEVRDYFGEPREGGDTSAPGLRRSEEARWFMAQAWDVLRMMVEMAQDHASDEWLAAVTDERQGVRGLRRDDVAGRFRVQVAFNADDLDQDKVIAKARVVGESLSVLDRNRRIDTDPILDVCMRSLYPDISEDTLITNERASGREIEEESRNLMKIRAGIMPEMDTQGNWDYRGRLAWYESLSAENPQVFADLPPDKRGMLEEWLKALAQQAVQFGENRAVGRSGSGKVRAG